MEQTENDWRKTLETNILGVVNFSKTIIPRMMEQKKGKIINIASVKGYLDCHGSWAYAASKAAVISLTSNMARDLAPHGILVNAVSPGFTETEMTAKTLTERTLKQVEQIPLKRMAEAKEIAETILFLASDKSNYIVGQNLRVSGGL
jgi:3-oxoacyl-[acyl-carrier protein] reductase